MIVENLEFEIKKSGEQAASGLEKLSTSLRGLKKSTGQNAIVQLTRNMTALNASLKSVDKETVTTIERLANALDKLSVATKGTNGRINVNVNARESALRDSQTKTSSTNITPISSDVSDVISLGSEIDVLNQKLVILKDNMTTALAAGNVKEAISARLQIIQVQKAIDKLGSSAEKSASKVCMLFKALGRIALYRVLRTIIKEITQAVQEGLENAYAYSNAVNGGLAQSLDRLASASQKMKNQLGAAFGELLQTLEPILIKVVNWITWIADKLSQLFAALGGRKTYLKARDVTKKWADDTEKGAKAAKEWKNQLLGFDEINRLEYDPTNSNGNGNNIDNPEEWFEEVPLDSWSMAISNFMDKVLIFKDKLDDWFDGLKQHCMEFVENIIPSVDGAVDSILEKLGELFPFPNLDPMRSGVLAFNEILEGVKLSASDLVTFIASLAPVMNFNPFLIGVTTAFTEAVSVAQKYGSQIISVCMENATILGEKITESVDGLLESISYNVGRFKENVVTLASSIVSSAVTNISTLESKVSSAIENIRSKSMYTITTIQSSVQQTCVAIGGYVDGIVSSLQNKLGNLALSLSNQISQFSEKFKSEFEQMKGRVSEWGESVVSSAKQAVGKLQTETIPAIKQWGSQVASNFSQVATTIVNGVGSAIQGAWSKVQSFMSSALSSISTWVSNIRNSVSNALSSVGSTISSFASSAVNSVKSTVSNIWSSITSPSVSYEANGMKTYNLGNTPIIGSSVSGIGSFASNLLPAFASGGFAEDGLFLANSGELVGQFSNGKTAIANNEMIVEGIKNGVYEAVMSAMNNSNGGSQNINLIVDGRKMADVVTQYQRRDSRAMGV